MSNLKSVKTSEDLKKMIAVFKNKEKARNNRLNTSRVVNQIQSDKIPSRSQNKGIKTGK